jgi:hypothetical protein
MHILLTMLPHSLIAAFLLWTGAATTESRFTKYKISATSTGNFTTSSTTTVDVTNATLSFKASGRPIVITMQSDGTANTSGIGVFDGVAIICNSYFYIDRGGSNLNKDLLSISGAAGTLGSFVPTGSIKFLDTTAVAGTTYTYKLRMDVSAATTTGYVNYAKLVVYELP